MGQKWLTIYRHADVMLGILHPLIYQHNNHERFKTGHISGSQDATQISKLGPCLHHCPHGPAPGQGHTEQRKDDRVGTAVRRPVRDS